MVLGNSMLIPVLPAIKKALHVNLSQVGLLITVFSIPAGIVIPFAGLLSDRIGRKTVMVPALIVYGIGGILAGLAGVLVKQSYYLLLGARVIQGIGAGGTYQLAMALAGDEHPRQGTGAGPGFPRGRQRAGQGDQPLGRRGVGPHQLADTVLRLWRAGLSHRGGRFFPGAGKKKPAGGSQSIGQYFQGFWGIVKKKGASLAVAFLAGMAVLFTLFGVLSFFADVLEKSYHIEVFGRGLILALPVLGMAVTSFILGIVLKKKPAALIKPFSFAGLLFVAVGLALFALLPTKKWGMIPPIIATILVGLGTGSTLPPVNTLITSAAPRKERGGLTCLYGTVRFFGVAIGPPVFALGMKGLKTPLYLGIAAGVALIAVLSLVVIKPGQVLPQNMTGGKAKGGPGGKGGKPQKPKGADDDWEPIEGI